jgi:hypothetical protein
MLMLLMLLHLSRQQGVGQVGTWQQAAAAGLVQLQTQMVQMQVLIKIQSQTQVQAPQRPAQHQIGTPRPCCGSYC